MLAKLARWLRLFGISVENPRYVEDDRLLKYSKRTGSILLTSDRALNARARKLGVESLLISDKQLDSQLRYVIKALKLKPKASEKICPMCNSSLTKISKERASKLVKKGISIEYESFYYCRKCRKVYWQGSHWRDINTMLGKVANKNLISNVA